MLFRSSFYTLAFLCLLYPSPRLPFRTACFGFCLFSYLLASLLFYSWNTVYLLSLTAKAGVYHKRGKAASVVDVAETRYGNVTPLR